MTQIRILGFAWCRQICDAPALRAIDKDINNRIVSDIWTQDLVFAVAPRSGTAAFTPDILNRYIANDDAVPPSCGERKPPHAS